MPEEQAHLQDHVHGDNQTINSASSLDGAHGSTSVGSDGNSHRLGGVATATPVLTSDEAAQVVFEVVPQVMQNLRAEMRRRRGAEISVLQLRALAFLRRNPGTTLSLLAEHVGLTLPSMSSQVSGLVARKLIDRSVSTSDRRFITLRLTESGSALLAAARQGTQESLAKSISVLSPHEMAAVVEGLRLLARVFAPTPTEAPQTNIINQPSPD